MSSLKDDVEKVFEKFDALKSSAEAETQKAKVELAVVQGFIAAHATKILYAALGLILLAALFAVHSLKH